LRVILPQLSVLSRQSSAKASHAKAQSGGGAKKTNPFFFASFAHLRLGVRLFVFPVPESCGSHCQQMLFTLAFCALPFDLLFILCASAPLR